MEEEEKEKDDEWEKEKVEERGGGRGEEKKMMTKVRNFKLHWQRKRMTKKPCGWYPSHNHGFKGD